MSLIYYLSLLIISSIIQIRAYDTFNKEIIFNLDCNKVIRDKSAFNTFITSYGVTLTMDRNNSSEMACSFGKPNIYLKTTLNNLITSQMTITFWFKKTKNNSFTILSFNNKIKGFSILYDSTQDQLKFIDKESDKVILTTNYNNIYWNQITLSISINKGVLVFNQSMTVSIYTLPIITSDYYFYIGAENENSNTAMNGYIDNLKMYKMFLDFESFDLTKLIMDNNCEDNQAFIDGICFRCSNLSNCKSCFNTTHCAVCNQGFSLTNVSNCLCQKESCSKCNYDGSCSKCDDGYQLNEHYNCILNNCTHLDYCTKCIDDVCLECIGNYLIAQDKCELPSLAITGVVITFLFVVVVIWIVILIIVRPKLIT